MYKGYIERKSLQELYQTAVVRAGQYLVIDALDREFPFDQFQLLFKNLVFPLYAKYVYKSDRKCIYVTYASPFVFPEPAPDIVSSVIPQSIYGIYIGEFLHTRLLYHVSYLSTKPLTRFSVPWEYRKPALYIGYQGQVEVRCHWKLRYDEVTGEVEIDPETLDILLDLCAGYIMTALGRSRRMVRIGDTNLEFDAEAMVTEGEELIKEARERLLQFADLTALNF